MCSTRGTIRPDVAWVQKVQRRDGPRYRAFWREPGGRRIRSKTFRRRRDAEAFARALEVKKDTGVYLDPAFGEVPFGEFFRYFLDTATHLKPSSRALYAKHARLYLLPAFEGRAIGGIGPADVRAFLAELGTRTGPSTVRAVHRLLRRVLGLAVEEGRVGRNPAARVKLPAERRRAPRYLTAEEVARLASEVPGRYRPLVLLLAYTGLRIGEAAALRVSDIDFLRGRLQVARAAVEVDGVMIEGTTKGGRARTVALPAFLRDELARHVGGPTDPEAHVFPGERGAILRPSWFRRRIFRPAARRAGLEPLPRVHDLRHTAVALAVAAGYHPRAVQEMAGHASIRTTFDVYGGLFDTLQQQATARLDAIAAQAMR